MKKTSKILALIVAVIMIFSCFTGCGKKKVVKELNHGGKLIIDSAGSGTAPKSDGNISSGSSSSGSPEKSVKLTYEEQEDIADTIGSYFYSIATLNPEYCLYYIDPSSDLYQETEASIETTTADSFGLSEEDFSAFGSHIFWESSHQVVDIEYDGVEAVATVDFSMPNIEDFTPGVDAVDDLSGLDKIEDTAILTLKKIDGEWLVTKDY